MQRTLLETAWTVGYVEKRAKCKRRNKTPTISQKKSSSAMQSSRNRQLELLEVRL
jgi:hypothetical protein